MATGMADDGGPPPFVEVPAAADTPEAVVRFLVGWLIADRRLPVTEQESVVGQVLRREQLGSTGIGRGLAIPHTTSAAIERPAFVVGRLAVPVAWAAIDRTPVRLVVLMVGPRSGPGAHLRELEEIIRRLRGT